MSQGFVSNTIGKHEILREIGRGAMGTVYLALDASLQREVAVKLIHPSLDVDARLIGKFKNEARTSGGGFRFDELNPNREFRVSGSPECRRLINSPRSRTLRTWHVAPPNLPVEPLSPFWSYPRIITLKIIIRCERLCLRTPRN